MNEKITPPSTDPAEAAAWIEFHYQQGWSDGLPLVPPTEESVGTMLDAGKIKPSEIIGTIAERNATIPAEKVAINAVMAGCLAEYFPVVLAAVRCLCRPEFHYHNPATSTGGSALTLIVNGPIGPELGINAIHNAFGPGVRANATIGRALRLVMLNVLNTRPGLLDKATLGSPGKYAFCFAENEERSPWEPRHIELGYDREESIVTVAGIRGINAIMETTVATGIEVMQTIVGTMKAAGIANYYQLGTGSQIVLVLCPEHADDVAASGLTKDDMEVVAEWVYHCRETLKGLVLGTKLKETITS